MHTFLIKKSILTEVNSSLQKFDWDKSQPSPNAPPSLQIDEVHRKPSSASLMLADRSRSPVKGSKFHSEKLIYRKITNKMDYVLGRLGKSKTSQRIK